jgi:hypothetical protein
VSFLSPAKVRRERLRAVEKRREQFRRNGRLNHRETMAVRMSLRRLAFPTFVAVALAGFAPVGMAQSRVAPPLTSKWSPGAIPGGGGITVSAYPIVAGEPFTANNDSRDVETVNGMKLTYESHSIVARDASGRVATRNAESPHVPFPGEKNRSSAFIAAGGSVIDPVVGVRLWWNNAGSPRVDNVVMKSRTLESVMPPRRRSLTACEKEAGQTRHLRNGVTQHIENLGLRRIDNLLAEGCRVTTFIPAGADHGRVPRTITEDRWVSPKLRVTLLYVFHGPNGEQRRRQLDNVVLGEPDPSLFAPPRGYTVRDLDAERKREEEAEFTVQPGEPDAEMLAGAWEANDPFAPYPAQMGIFVQIVANRRVPFYHRMVTGNGPQKFLEMQVRVYERIGGKDEGGWFSTTAPDGVSWDGHRLRILPTHVRPDTFAHGELALDLTFNEQKDLWTGSYTRGGVTKRAELVRPGALSKTASNPFLGAWSDPFLGVWSESGRSGPSPPAPHMPRCVYITRGSDGTLVSWRDTLFGPAVDPSEGLSTAMFQEDDGDALGVKIDGDTLMLQEGIYWAAIGGNAPERFTGMLSHDGMHIIGKWMPPGPQPSWNEAPGPQGQQEPASRPVTTYTRTTSQSCWSNTIDQ